MVGLLPLKMVLSMSPVIEPDAKIASSEAVRHGAEAELVRVLTSISPWARGAIHRGLLRANAVLVGSFVASEHRACPLASAVWELTGEEPASQFAVELSLAHLGLTHAQGRRFAGAFDDWARVCGYVRVDRDRSRGLTHVGRSRLLTLFEELPA
jgi:hypothetical protein